MRLASSTDFGLRVLMRLAGAPDRPISTGQIAEEFRISQHHLAKVVQDLGRGGFVQSQRGRNGGLVLARPAETITLGEVVRHLEQGFAMVECFRADGGMCVLQPQCRLRSKFAAAREAFLSFLDETSVAECAWPDMSQMMGPT
jgi:Rrf2 family nitric oxide-sensitive transcriptional repressor